MDWSRGLLLVTYPKAAEIGQFSKGLTSTFRHLRRVVNHCPLDIQRMRFRRIASLLIVPGHRASSSIEDSKSSAALSYFADL